MERIAVRRWFFLFWLAAWSVGAQAADTRSLVLVIGAAGEPEYAEQFSRSAKLWKIAAEKGGLQLSVIGEATNRPEEDRARLLTALTNEVGKANGELWIVLIGHGTFDGKTANFNLRGPDISANELAEALKPCRRPLALINCASASGPFCRRCREAIELLSPPHAVVTK